MSNGGVPREECRDAQNGERVMILRRGQPSSRRRGAAALNAGCQTGRIAQPRSALNAGAVIYRPVAMLGGGS